MTEAHKRASLYTDGKKLQSILKGSAGEESPDYIPNSSKTKKDLIYEIDFISQNAALKLVEELESGIANVREKLPVESNSSVTSPYS